MTTMAYTKIKAVKNHLKRCLDYAANPAKTKTGQDLQDALTYAHNSDKTEQQLFVTGFNCDPAHACEVMLRTETIWGKETERTTSQSIGKGSRGSSSESRQTAGRELLTPDEVRRIERGDALLLMSSEDPVIDRKFDLYVLPPDYMSEATTLSAAELATLEPDKVPAEILDQYEWIELEEIDEDELDETLDETEGQPG